jgi:hypothetical protein
MSAIARATGGWRPDELPADPMDAVVVEPGFLYHGTGRARLPGITSQGLVPSTRSRFARDPFVGAHSLGKVFLTTDPRKAWFYAREASKTAPLLLRIAVDDVEEVVQDAKETDSVYVDRVVDASALQRWSGSCWKPLR